jgi:hypothetical protein
MDLRTKKTFSWGLISFFTTTAIVYVFVGNWVQTIIIATVSVLPEIFDFAFLENKEIIQISRTYGLTSEEMIRK